MMRLRITVKALERVGGRKVPDMNRLLLSFTICTIFILGVHPPVLAAEYQKVWEAPLTGSLDLRAFKNAPVVDLAGNIYLATKDAVYSFDSLGNKRWQYQNYQGDFWPGLVLATGKVYAVTSSYYGLLTALNAATGEKLWEVDVNPNNITAYFGTPQILNGRIYVAYESVIPGANNHIKSFDIETGKQLAEATTGSIWGIVSNDLAAPHLTTSKAQIFMPTFNNYLLSITRTQLSASADRGFSTRDSPAPVLTSDDQHLILVSNGNNLDYFKINADGEMAANPLFSVDLGALPRTKAIVVGDLILVNVGTPTELVAVSVSQKKIAWRRALNTTFATLPSLVSDNFLAEVTSKLTLLDLTTGEIKQEIDLGAAGENNFTGAVASNGQVYFINKDYKLVAYGLSTPVLPKHHPVIFIHGLGGSPAEWDSGGDMASYKEKLWDVYSKDDPTYNKDWLVSYSYTGTDEKTGGYNSQGRIEDISLGMEQAVATLSARHKAAGGDGQVDVLGYSLGGLVIREYLATHSSNNNIHQAVTIASPHQGAFFADIRKAADVFGFIPTVKAYVVSLMQAVVEAAGANVDSSKAVIEELYPDSDYVKNLRSKEVSPSPIFNVIAGSINVKFKQRLFDKDFTFVPLDVGDLFMSENSATTITPMAPDQIIPFSQDLTVPLRFSRDGGVIGLDVSVPTFDALKYYHLKIMQQNDVLNKAVDLLANTSL